MKVVYWGTYDKGKPRNRILLRGLQECGAEITECHRSIWSGIEDKSQIKSLESKIFLLFKWLFSYPRLVYLYLKIPKHDCVVVGYLGHLDVLILWPFSKLRRMPLVWDAFISLYDTVVNDRQLLRPNSLLAKILFNFEWLVCKAADMVVLDTNAHAEYFREQYGLSKKKCVAVFVGAEIDNFPRVSGCNERKKTDDTHFSVLFYGQFIPLHGIETIVQAAEISKDNLTIQWTIIGTGQEAGKIKKMVDKAYLNTFTWIEWVNYEELKSHIHAADVCLGIFGSSGKSARVIPNKVYQIISTGKPLITRDSPAIRELFSDSDQGIYLVPAGNPAALADTIKVLAESKDASNEPYFEEKLSRISQLGVGNEFLSYLQQVIGQQSE